MAGLTPREREVLELVGAGLSNQAIARSLRLTEGTVKTYVERDPDPAGGGQPGPGGHRGLRGQARSPSATETAPPRPSAAGRRGPGGAGRGARPGRRGGGGAGGAVTERKAVQVWRLNGVTAATAGTGSGP